MSPVKALKCVQCGAVVPPDADLATCPACGPDEGILDVEMDLEAAAASLTPAAMPSRPLCIWRYRELLPLEGAPPAELAHIGWTPMIEAPRLARELGIGRLRLKDEGRSASGSFKDRASAIGVARALEQGAIQIACASTGNAASSLAHCAAAAGLPANIFVSERIPAGKLAQLLAYGARVFKVRGTYDQAYELCMQACEALGWYNRNCAVNPYLVEGKKTGGLEVAEQCAADPPDWVAASVGDGCSIAGVAKGLEQMRQIGFIDWPVRMLGVQAATVAPITRAFTDGALAPWGEGSTYADSIDCPVPRNWRKAVRAVTASQGAYVDVTDAQIRKAVRLTGHLTGIFAEPAAAAAVAGVALARSQGILNDQSSVVAIISGNGLKDIDGALSAVGEPHSIGPELDQVLRIVEHESGDLS